MHLSNTKNKINNNLKLNNYKINIMNCKIEYNKLNKVINKQHKNIVNTLNRVKKKYNNINN